jgi:hypothetical protein
MQIGKRKQTEDFTVTFTVNSKEAAARVRARRLDDYLVPYSSWNYLPSEDLFVLRPPTRQNFAGSGLLKFIHPARQHSSPSVARRSD